MTVKKKAVNKKKVVKKPVAKKVANKKKAVNKKAVNKKKVVKKPVAKKVANKKKAVNKKKVVAKKVVKKVVEKVVEKVVLESPGVSADVTIKEVEVSEDRGTEVEFLADSVKDAETKAGPKKHIPEPMKPNTFVEDNEFESWYKLNTGGYTDLSLILSKVLNVGAYNVDELKVKMASVSPDELTEKEFCFEIWKKYNK